jgi:hypothetical protein
MTSPRRFPSVTALTRVPARGTSTSVPARERGNACALADGAYTTGTRRPEMVTPNVASPTLLLRRNSAVTVVPGLA